MGARALPSRGSIENIPAELFNHSLHTPPRDTHVQTVSVSGVTVGFYRIWVGLLSDTYSGSKTPGGAGTHTGHTGAHGHTDHTDEPHNHQKGPEFPHESQS